MSIRKRFGMMGIFAACMSMLCPVSAQTLTLKITNTSEVGIFSIYMSRPDHATWGGDTLGDGKLAPGTATTITGIAPGSYNMKLVDENGNSCVIHKFGIYSRTVRLNITPDLLLRCEGVNSSIDDNVSSAHTRDLASDETKNYQVIRIFFATDRQQGQRTGELQEFTAERAADERLTLGSAEVSIPRDHQMGELEAPSVFRLEFRPDPEKHVVLLTATVLEKQQFGELLNSRLDRDPKRRAIVFVPGYSVTFENGARRLAQITYDLGFSGAPILFSWPTRGTLFGYTADEATAEWSSAHLLSFLQTLQEQSGVKTIYLIGHSMGNRLIASALRSIADHPTTPDRTKISGVIMAAPDIDAGFFKQIADPLLTSGVHITIYESSRDFALKASHKFHGYPRLGDTDPTVHVLKNYECIEASSVDTDLLGHSYVRDSTSVLSDIFDLIGNGSPATQRFRLSEQHTLDGLPYWSFKK
jgi:esterase/lipase superfamily enzyme